MNSSIKRHNLWGTFDKWVFQLILFIIKYFYIANMRAQLDPNLIAPRKPNNVIVKLVKYLVNLCTYIYRNICLCAFSYMCQSALKENYSMSIELQKVAYRNLNDNFCWFLNAVDIKFRQSQVTEKIGQIKIIYYYVNESTKWWSVI